MRPGQNKRMRGRTSNSGSRKGPNPLTRSYESNGPDVKIRGTANHVAEKYLQLARDAHSSGDPVTAESYLQHAEHYFRLIAAAQQAQQQNNQGLQRIAGESEVDEVEEDDDFSGILDRFASPVERFIPPPPAFGSPQPQNGSPYQERSFYNANDRSLGDRVNGDRVNGERLNNERQGNERSTGERNSSDRSGGERHVSERSGSERQGNDRHGGERSGYERPDRSPRVERPYNDRASQDRGQERYSQDRNIQDRGGSERGGQERPYREQEGRGQEYRAQEGRGPRGRAPRDYRNDSQRTDSQRNDQRLEPRLPLGEIEPKGLPAFITAPVRIQPEPYANEPENGSFHLEAAQPAILSQDLTVASSEAQEVASDFHLRPRRRRRTKAEIAADQKSASETSDAKDPVGE